MFLAAYILEFIRFYIFQWQSKKTSIQYNVTAFSNVYQACNSLSDMFWIYIFNWKSFKQIYLWSLSVSRNISPLISMVLCILMQLYLKRTTVGRLSTFNSIYRECNAFSNAFWICISKTNLLYEALVLFCLTRTWMFVNIYFWMKVNKNKHALGFHCLQQRLRSIQCTFHYVLNLHF